MTLQGAYRTPASGYHEGNREWEGTVLLAYAGRGSQDGKPFIYLAGQMAVLAGIMIHYPETTFDIVPPAPYPPCIFSDKFNITIMDCVLYNPYEGIRLVSAYRHVLRNVHGYPTWRGIYIDDCWDIGRLENCQLGPMMKPWDPSSRYMQWVFQNGTAYEIGRSDWEYFLNTFCFGYKIGYKFIETKYGNCNGNFQGIGADRCQRPVLVEQTNLAGLLFTNGEFVGQWGTTNSVGVEIAPACKGPVQFSNCSFWGPNDRLIWLRSPQARVTASACNFAEYDTDGDDSPAIQIDAGRAIIQGCGFAEGTQHVLVGS